MKKVLIISYYFPPCNLTAANRIFSWAKYLYQSGYHPVIITRNWDNPVNSAEDILLSAGSEVVVEENEHYTVHYLPYHASVRDRMFTSGSAFLKKFSRPLTFAGLILQNFTNAVIPYQNIYDYSAKLIKADPSLDKLVISGNPFEQFRFGHLLQKRFSVKWIADYRDGWNTQEMRDNRSPVFRLIRALERRSEKKWTGSASMITSVSDHYVKKISELVSVKGELLLNGYFEDDRAYAGREPLAERLTIGYSGALYEAQRIELFLDGYKAFVDQFETPPKCEMVFIGLRYFRKQANRVGHLMQGYENYYRMTDRVSRTEALEQLSRSHLLYLAAYGDFKGIPSSKIFEYIALERPVLLCPSDGDLMEKTLTDTGQALALNSKQEVVNALNRLYKSFLDGDVERFRVSGKNIEKYSRRHAAHRLAGMLDSI